MASEFCTEDVRNRLIYIEPAREDVVLGFNPLLYKTDGEGFYKVSRATDIVLRAWESVNIIVDPRNWTTTLGRDRDRIGPDLGGLHGSETATDRGGCEGEGCVGRDAGRAHDEPTGVAVRLAFHADRAMEAAIA